MNDQIMSASLNLDAKYIEMKVQEIVKAAIVSALGDRENLIRKAIDSTINQYVDGNGKPCSKGFWGATPFLDYCAQKTVEQTVRETILEVVEENKDAFKSEIKRQINTKRWKENVAESFVQLILDDAKSRWNMPVTVSLEKPKDYK